MVRAESLEAVTEYRDNDPLVKAGIQNYEIKEFNLFAMQSYAKAWKEDAED